MKKRLFSILIALISVFSFVACSKAELSVSFDDEKLPWEIAGGYEKCSYEVKKYARALQGDNYIDKTEVASGTFTQELSTESGITTLTSLLTITYADTDAANSSVASGNLVINRNKTDQIFTVVTFNEGLSPLSSIKEVVCEQREGENQPLAFRSAINYEANEKTFTFPHSAQEITVPANRMSITYGDKTKTYKAQGGNRYDNEQLFYVVRAMKNLKAKGSQSFYLSNPFDSYVNSKATVYTMNMTGAEKTVSIKLPTVFNSYSIIKNDKNNTPLAPNEQGDREIPCVNASIAISSNTSGPAIRLYYTDPSYSFFATAQSAAKTNKILMRIVQTEYDYLNAKEAFRTEYNLTNYSTTRS